MEVENKSITQLWREYENAKQFQSSILLSEQIGENIEAYEGKLWGDTFHLKETKDRPRCEVNWVKFIVDNKVSGVLNGKPTLSYFSKENEVAGKQFTEFSKQKWQDIDQDELCEEIVDDAAKKGTGIVHFYWDNEATGVKGRYKGGFVGETVDVRNFFVANPSIKNIQKQDYIIIVDRIALASVLAIADKSVNKKLIVPDEVDGTTKEQDGQKLVSVLTKYFKVDGIVHYQRATRKVVLHDPIALSPNQCDCESHKADVESSLSDEAKTGGVKNGFTVYPIAAFFWSKRDNCLYGISEAESIVKNQKIYNRIRSLEAEALQANAISRLVERKGAAPKGQKITNNPNQKLVDEYRGGGNGYYYLAPQTYSPALSMYGANLITDTRVATGSTEITSGEIGRPLSAVAYAQLQAQAEKPIKRMRKRFFKFIKDVGKIYENFFKVFYNEYENVQLEDESNFVGTQYADTNFDITVVAGESGEYSELGEMTLANELYAKGELSAKEYLEFLPETIFPNKGELIKCLENKENSQMQSIAQENQMLKQQLEQVAPVLQSILPTVEMNKKLLEKIALLQGEYTEKIMQANEAIMQAKQQEAITASVGLNEIEKLQANTANKGENTAISEKGVKNGRLQK